MSNKKAEQEKHVVSVKKITFLYISFLKQPVFTGNTLNYPVSLISPVYCSTQKSLINTHNDLLYTWLHCVRPLLGEKKIFFDFSTLPVS